MIFVFCLVVNFLSRILINNKIKAALIATLFIVINLYFQYLYNWIYELGLTKLLLDLLITIHPGRYIGSFLSIICFILLLLIIRTRKNLFSLNIYLNVVFSIFLIFEVGSILFIKPVTIELINSPNQTSGKLVKSILTDKPDIYFILLDAYTNSASLKKYWHYDNTPFKDSLSKIGFYCTYESKSEYDFTPYCLASYLNLSLLKIDQKKSLVQGWNQQKSGILDLIEKNTVTQNIVNSGYTFINYSIFEIGNTKRLYTTPVSTKDWKEPLSVFFIPTIFPAILSKIYKANYLDEEQVPLYPNLKVFQLLKDSINENSKTPIFVYAHILMPHEPFEYDENGKRTKFQDRNSLDNELYLKQLRYTNSLILETIQKILSSEKKKPIIIIQGDHGYRYLKNFNSKVQGTEAHSMFSSYLFPDELRIHLNDSIKPIQALSLLFDEH
jgi:hypothetical protein